MTHMAILVHFSRVTFFTEIFGDDIFVFTELPIDAKLRPSEAKRLSVVRGSITSEVVGEFQATFGPTVPFHQAVLAAYSTLLHRYTMQPEVIITCAVLSSPDNYSNHILLKVKNIST